MAQSKESPAHVELTEQAGRYTLSVDDKPFTIKGAGMGFTDHRGIGTLAAAGGNAFRTWELQHLDDQLAAARKYGLMVLVGLDTGKQLSGFDYDNTQAVAEQHARLTRVIERYRHHPSVLGWIIANEPNLHFDGQGAPLVVNPSVYDALGALVDTIHEIDPYHPVTVSFAFTPSLKEDIAVALQRAPHLDFISLQAYGALSAIPGLVAEMALDRPFMITEYGPLGHWEMPATSWGREIEEPSGVKAQGFLSRMQPVIMDDSTGKLVGAFAFLWGQKQERTPTWYGLFTEQGEKTAIVDELTQLWTGHYPDNRAPLTQSISLNGLAPTDSVHVVAGTAAHAQVVSIDPDANALTTRWELRLEVQQRSTGGHFEATPEIVPMVTKPMQSQSPTTHHDVNGLSQIDFVVPDQAGEYRLYAYTVDNNNGVGTANIPFLVEIP